MNLHSTEPAVESSLSDGANDETGRNQLDPTTAFDLLSSRRRRQVVSSLQRDEGALRSDDGTPRGDSWVSLTSLAAHVAATEEGTTPEAVADETRRNCRLSLYHVHLPKLADAGLVEYDASDNRVRPTETLEVLAERL